MSNVQIERAGSPSARRLSRGAGALRIWFVRILLILGLSTGFVPAWAEALVLDRALMTHGIDTAFPEAAGGRVVLLPDTWTRQSRGSEPAWYRLSFRADTRTPPLSAYLEHVCTDFRLVLNGQTLRVPRHVTQESEDMRTRACLEPALVELPPGLVREGNNLIDVQVFGLPPQRVASPSRVGGLGLVRVGTTASLQREWNQAHRLAIEVTIATGVTNARTEARSTTSRA